MNLVMFAIAGYLALMTPRLSDALDDDDDDDVTDYYYSNNEYEDFQFNVTNCTNDYCIPDEDYIGLMMEHIFPKLSDWVLIGMHSIVFVVGLIGNALVCMAVYRNHSMRTVTNYFIVNLAVADLLVLLICLPPSVVWDVTETWFLGLNLCKAVPYLQTVSVSVSVLTLTFISLDRWYAICLPFHQRFKSTTNRAKIAIIIIWVFSLTFDVPELLVLHTVPSQSRVQTILFTQCVWSWSQESQTTFTIVKLILLYTLPLLFMSIAYWRIVRVLWKSDIPGHNISTRTSHSTEMPLSGGGNPEGQLKSRRKAAKMLVAVVITFAICFFPVHLLSILRCTMDLPADQWTIVVSLIAHWLCYFNSAVNPLIYNFMSGKFRKEFKRAFQCHPNRKTSSRNRGLFSSVLNPLKQRSRRYTRSVNTTSMNNNVQTTEFIPISGIQQAENTNKNKNNS